MIRRIAHMGQTNPEVIHEVERGLESRMSSLMNQSFEKAGGVNSVAEILNVSDRATERSLLESLAQEDPELVEEIRRLMFVFDDLCKLSDKDIQTVLKNVETTAVGDGPQGGQRRAEAEDPGQHVAAGRRHARPKRWSSSAPSSSPKSKPSSSRSSISSASWKTRARSPSTRRNETEQMVS